MICQLRMSEVDTYVCSW